MKEKVAICVPGFGFQHRDYYDSWIKHLRDAGVEAELVFGLGRHHGCITRRFLRLIWSKTKIVHWLWGWPFWGGFFFIYLLLLRIAGKKIIVHWLGSDVLMALSSGRQVRMQNLVFSKLADLNVTDADPLIKELCSIGIKAEPLSLFADLNFPVKDIALPNQNRFFVYMPEGMEEFYGGDIIFKLAGEFAECEFLIAPHRGNDLPQLKNVKYLGHVKDMETDIWKNVKGCIRLTTHDGMSRCVKEALAYGRYVIWSHEYPNCHFARNYEEAKEGLRKIVEADHLNDGGRSYAFSEFLPTQVAEKYSQIYRKVLAFSDPQDSGTRQFY